MIEKEKYSVKDEIQKALLSIISQKPLMDITVTELVKEAKVARVSFYRHFASISDVVDSLAEKAADLFSDEIPPIYTKDERKWREFLFFYFYQITRNPDTFLIADISNTPAIISRINVNVIAILESQPVPTMQEMYSWVGKLGLLNSISKTWVEGGMKETPEEMIDYVMSIIKNF